MSWKFLSSWFQIDNAVIFLPWCHPTKKDLKHWYFFNRLLDNPTQTITPVAKWQTFFWTITSRGHWNFEPRMVSSILDLVSKHLHWTNQYWASYVPQVNNPQSVLGFLFWCLKTGLKRPDVELNTSCESGLILSGVDRSREALPAPASNNATCFSLDSSTNLILRHKCERKVQVTRKVFSQWISACCDYDLVHWQTMNTLWWVLSLWRSGDVLKTVPVERQRMCH